MRPFFFFFALAGLALGCGNERPAPLPPQQQAPAPEMPHTLFKRDVLFSFAQTSDAASCNPNAIVASDCAGGDLYFTKKGDVVYRFFCMGEDSASYSIGTYVVRHDSIHCRFDRDYSYYTGQVDDTLTHDPNSGQLRSVKPFPLGIAKSGCTGMPFRFTSSDGKEQYVLIRENDENTKDFQQRLARIKVFAGL